MSRRRWFFHFLKRSISQRMPRVAVASFSIMLASAIMVSSVGLSFGIREKLGGELKAYGANVMITPKNGNLDDDVLKIASGVTGIEGVSGQLYASASIKGTSVEIVGMDIEAVKKQGWKLEGSWPGAGEALAGVNIRDAFGIKAGDTIELALGEKKASIRISGFIERGGPEDGSLLLALKDAQRIAGLEGKLSAALVRAKTANIDDIVKTLREKIAPGEVKTLRQVAYAEESFLKKIELLMALVSLVVLIASSISVSSTMSATVLERIKEIGLMMAIGGTRGEISRFYIVEGMVIGLAGGLSGYIIGFLSAQAVSKGAFHSFVDVPLFVLPVSLLMGVLISVFSSAVPVIDALRSKPSVVLRGE